MTSPESEDSARSELPRGPEEPARPAGSADARRFEVPTDVDAAFAAIVADWADADAPRWPDDPTSPDSQLASGIGLATPPQGWPTAHPERTDEPGRDVPPPGPTSPGSSSSGTSSSGTSGTAPTPGPAAPAPRPSGPRDHHVDDTPGGFVPPEPPPLPRIGLSSLAGLLLLVAGVVLLALPALVGGVAGLGIVPGLLAMTAGLGWLVVGMRRSADSDEPGEDGEL